MSKPTYMLNNVEALYPKLDQPYHFDRQGGKTNREQAFHAWLLPKELRTKSILK